MPEPDENDVPTPLRPIRRFDVFAEYSRLERLEKGFPDDEAKGYGVWLAKVVAARRFGQKSGSADRARPAARDAEADEQEQEPKFRSVGDELQTDATFDEDIIDRMGDAFYDGVFAPAIAEAHRAGKSYKDIRDEIRKGWKPARSKAR